MNKNMIVNLYSIIYKKYIFLKKKLSSFTNIDIEHSEYFITQGKNWRSNPNMPIAIAWAIAPWKTKMISPFLTEYRVAIAKGKGQWQRKKRILDRYEGLTFIVWGYQEPREIAEYAADRGIPLYRLEDGFIRSSTLGAQHTMPYSLVLDKTGLYFDATQPSDLENLLNFYPFEQNQDLMRVARQLLTVMRELHVSKYNLGVYGLSKLTLPETRKQRILVIGQVPKDASLKYGLARDWSDERLLEKARDDNPEAEILYRPHPETLYLDRVKGLQSSELSNEPWCTVVSGDIIMAELFHNVDHVYTMTSLCGMEALIHGLRVTTVGMPFYAGWGLTYDLQKCRRRKRKLTIEELFCGVYILYPRYYNHPGEPISGFLETISKVLRPRFNTIDCSISF